MIGKPLVRPGFDADLTFLWIENLEGVGAVGAPKKTALNPVKIHVCALLSVEQPTFQKVTQIKAGACVCV